MKKLKLILFLLAPLWCFAQNTVILPTPTTSATPQWRYYNPADSLRQHWVVIPGMGNNRMISFTEFKKYGVTYTGSITDVNIGNHDYFAGNGLGYGGFQG